MRATNRPPALAPMPLEPRDNPAGNVTVTLFGADLFVAGDAADNQFSVQQNGLGDVFVFGLSGTTVNCQSAVFVGRGALGNVSVQGGAGADQVEMIGVFANGFLGVTAGDENDVIALRGVTAGAATVDAQGGDDLVVTDGVFAFNSADVSGGTGFDAISFGTGGIGGGFVNVREFEQVV